MPPYQPVAIKKKPGKKAPGTADYIVEHEQKKAALVVATAKKALSEAKQRSYFENFISKPSATIPDPTQPIHSKIIQKQSA